MPCSDAKEPDDAAKDPSTQKLEDGKESSDGNDDSKNLKNSKENQQENKERRGSGTNDDEKKNSPESDAEDKDPAESAEAASAEPYKEYMFLLNDWVKVTEDVDCWKESPVNKDEQKDILPGIRALYGLSVVLEREVIGVAPMLEFNI